MKHLLTMNVLDKGKNLLCNNVINNSANSHSPKSNSVVNNHSVFTQFVIIATDWVMDNKLKCS